MHAKRARVAKEKRQKIIARRFSVMDVEAWGELRDLRVNEHDLSEQVKNFPLDRELQKRHKDIIKRKSDLEKQLPPPEWKLKPESNATYYEINLRLCRMTKFRWFPPLGDYPGQDDPEMHEKRKELGKSESGPWYCLRLDCSVNQLTKLGNEPFMVFHELRSLNLSSNQLGCIGEDGLKGLGYLRELDLSNNYIEAINGLSACPRLVNLNLSSNKVVTIKNLGKLERLKKLNFSGNKIVRLRGLDKLKSLTDLNLDRNEIIEIDHLGLVPSLSTLHVRENKIRDMDKFGLVMVTMKKLNSLYLEGNPICESRDFRLRVLENTRITTLDAIDVKPQLREYLREIKRKEDLEDIVNQTTEDYMARMDQQKEQKTTNLEVLRKRETELEEAFTKYRSEMEMELQECISYIHSLDTREDLRKQSFLSTEEGLQAWRKRLQEDSEARQRSMVALKQRQQMESLDKTATRSGVVKYTEKLKELATLRPGVWREMKRREYEARTAEIDGENKVLKRASKEERGRKKKIRDRQLNRQRHMLDHIDDYEAEPDQWWDGGARKAGSTESPKRLHQREKKKGFEDERDNGSESDGGGTPKVDGEEGITKETEEKKLDSDKKSNGDAVASGQKVEKDVESSTKSSENENGSTYTVVFTKPTEGFGIGFAGTNGCKVTKLKPGSAADKCGVIKPGHLIMSTNGTDVSETDKETLKQSMKSASKSDAPFVLGLRDPAGETTGKIETPKVVEAAPKTSPKKKKKGFLW